MGGWGKLKVKSWKVKRVIGRGAGVGVDRAAHPRSMALRTAQDHATRVCFKGRPPAAIGRAKCGEEGRARGDVDRGVGQGYASPRDHRRVELASHGRLGK